MKGIYSAIPLALMAVVARADLIGAGGNNVVIPIDFATPSPAPTPGPHRGPPGPHGPHGPDDEDDHEHEDHDHDHDDEHDHDHDHWDHEHHSSCSSPTPTPVTLTRTETQTFCPHDGECHHHHKPTPEPWKPEPWKPEPTEKIQTVYTTVFQDLCETGITSKTYTITSKCPCTAPHGPDHIPEGFTSTVKSCHTCGPKPITATCTVPVETVPTGVNPVHVPGVAAGSISKIHPIPGKPTPGGGKPGQPQSPVVPFTGGAGSSFSGAGIAMALVAGVLGAVAVAL